MILKNNTMDKLEFIISTIVYACVGVFVYNAVLFVPIEGLTARVSRIILFAVMLVFVTMSTITSFKSMRNEVIAITNILLPLGIYSFISYYNFFRTWLIVTLLTAFVGVVVVAILISYINRKNNSSLEDESHSRKINVLPYIKPIIAFNLCIFMVPMTVSSLLGRDIYIAKISEPVEIKEDRQETIMANMNIIGKIERWEELPISEKLGILDCVKSIELEQLGVKTEVYLTADTLDENVFSGYLMKHNKIQMNIAYLESREVSDLFEDVIRQCYHVYLSEQILMYQSLDEKYRDLDLFTEVKAYQKELATYSDLSRFEDYSNQQFENYVEEAFDDYWVVINDWYDTKIALNIDE